jgi:hypothetical protein
MIQHALEQASGDRHLLLVAMAVVIQRFAIPMVKEGERVIYHIHSCTGMIYKLGHHPEGSSPWQQPPEYKLLGC